MLNDDGVIQLINHHLHLETLVQKTQKILLEVLLVMYQKLMAHPLADLNKIHQTKIAKVFIWLQYVGMKGNLLHSWIRLKPWWCLEKEWW